jgi:hypothetical protein
MAKTNVKALTMATFNTTGLTTAYQSANGAGFSNAIFFLRIVNDSDRDITISYNGVADHDYIPIGGALEIGSQQNAQPNAKEALFPVRTQVFVKGASAGTGIVTISGYYV